MLLLISCQSEFTPQNNFESTLEIKNIFPENKIEGIARDTEFRFWYRADNINNLIIKIESDQQKISFPVTITGKQGVITFSKILPAEKEIKISIKPLPTVTTCYSVCQTSEEFIFYYKTGTSFSSDPLKIEEVKPCKTCYFKPDKYEIRFSKPISMETLSVLRKMGYSASLENNITLIIKNSEVNLPKFIGDIYGEKLTATVKITPLKPCFHIKEICVNPRDDWNDSRGGDHIPFSEKPGYGSINSYDQFVMVENRCSFSPKEDKFYLEICQGNSCDFQGFIPGNRKSYSSGNFYIFGDPPGTLSGGERIRLFYDNSVSDEVLIPEQFTPRGGWWRNSATYTFEETSCVIP